MRIEHSTVLVSSILAAWCLCASAQTAMPPGHPSSKELMAAEGVMTSANIARGAADVCHLDAAKVARFKDVVRTSYPDAPDFDGEWKLGLAQAQPAVDRFDKLKTSNPAEYQKQVGEACPALRRGIDEVTQPQQ
ncbi:hypothetical protein AWB76_00300 [Caballeronia temeraria]|uniref:Uncharacterized protein n=1 Tax=Caballeronia temeraria TaxID=1777137 RepID=A0A157Z887_9BURK|nr:hypothetical protein [Caballeronia temeraria]SAK41653.1 hypothetical protein AWB76_00300 [Caballeronia temeraria]